jgi:hypothetical protein
MARIFCPDCRLEQSSKHAFCPRCGGVLPVELVDPGRSKKTRFFAGTKMSHADKEGSFLRVSCYREEQTLEAPEGTVTIPGHHVRFSIWNDSRARCVLSLPETEARALAEFVLEELPSPRHGLDEPFIT